MKPTHVPVDEAVGGEIDRLIARIAPRLIALRHNLHRHPELSHEEARTTSIVEAALADLGLASRRGPDDLGLIIDSGPPGPRIALRADLDALALTEETGLPYASKVPGVMHACGHDIHTACLVGAVRALTSVVPDVPLRFLFQPAEEATPGGALGLIEAGAMENVRGIFALHCDPRCAVGTLGVRPGPLTAACDVFHLRIHGRGGHGARPHETQDTVLVAAQIIQAVHHAFDRGLDARQPFVISFGTIRAGGTSSNVIPADVSMSGTIRTPHEAARHAIEPIFGRVLDGVCAAWELDYELKIEAGAPPVFNDARLVESILLAGRAVGGEDSLASPTLPSMGGEDFSWYLPHAPGAMFRIGVGVGSPLHSSTFQADDAVIALGARILARSALGVDPCALEEREPSPDTPFRPDRDE